MCDNTLVTQKVRELVTTVHKLQDKATAEDVGTDHKTNALENWLQNVDSKVEGLSKWSYDWERSWKTADTYHAKDVEKFAPRCGQAYGT